MKSMNRADAAGSFRQGSLSLVIAACLTIASAAELWANEQLADKLIIVPKIEASIGEIPLIFPLPPLAYDNLLSAYQRADSKAKNHLEYLAEPLAAPQIRPFTFTPPIQADRAKKGMRKAPQTSTFSKADPAQTSVFPGHEPKFPLKAGEIFKFTPDAEGKTPELPKSPGSAKPSAKDLPFSLPAANPKVPGEILPPGVYLTDPYSLVVLAPPPGVDDKMIIGSNGAADTAMPAIKPGLEFIPLK